MNLPRTWTRENETLALLLMWSASLPGVAITTWGRLESSRAWVIMSSPPTITLVRRLRGAPRAVNCSPIWNASSLCT